MRITNSADENKATASNIKLVTETTWYHHSGNEAG